ncbi:hypothetical protein JOC77_000394 [Peribacillus deserti]|uniref:Uncharacterized protein n=1 Tax=Peribacillus deserti TaxID=673318 RepID=A0ABS2QCW0_9BACI|nr:hypothetical protein [Peribacillus deserti]MBM7690991.1 hypothetical protein [Peribacillus deserti]
MYLKGLRILDMINIVFGLFTALLLFVYHSIWIDGLLIAASVILLWKTKFNNRKLLLFSAYFISSWYLASLLTSPVLLETIHVRELHMHPLWIPVIALLIGLIAASFRFGTSTLTFIWFSLFILVSIEAIFQGGTGAGMLHRFWTASLLAETIHRFFPFLIAAACIGIFLEKFQNALVIDYINNK